VPRTAKKILPSIYPAIDPQTAFESKRYAGKVALVTGASRGIGQTIALFYAKAGAALAVVARTSLDETKALILKEVADAEVIEFAADVKDSQRAEEIVKATVARFGRLDILVANAGAVNPWTKRGLTLLALFCLSRPVLGMGDQDADKWWEVLEVNLRGVYNYLRSVAGASLKGPITRRNC
jgi:NAD(P)-dependent dehydrogenase (short-subunit alcohol dehydrogenase family)